MRTSPFWRGVLCKDYSTLPMRLAASSMELLGRVACRARAACPIRRQSIKTLAILKFDRIGDTFLATPTIEACRKLFPEARIVFFAGPWNHEILTGNPHIDELHVVTGIPDVHRNSRADFFGRKAIRQVASVIREQAPDLVIDLQGNPLTVLAMSASRSPIRVGFDRKLLSFLLTTPVWHSDHLHQTEVYGSIARQLGWTGPLPKCSVFTDDDVTASVEQVLRRHDLDAFFMFHLNTGHSYKRWPVANFALLADTLLAEHRFAQLVLTGGKEDHNLGRRFIELTCYPERVVNLIGNLTLRPTYALMTRALGFVGNDSALGHLAAHAGIPTVVLMNSWTGIERWRALGPKVQVAYRDQHPCAGTACTLDPCPNMDAITPDEVNSLFAAALRPDFIDQQRASRQSSDHRSTRLPLQKALPQP